MHSDDECPRQVIVTRVTCQRWIQRCGLPSALAVLTILAIAFAPDVSWFGYLGRTLFPVLWVYATRFAVVQQLSDRGSAAVVFYLTIAVVTSLLSVDPGAEYKDKFNAWLGLWVVLFAVPSISFAVFELGHHCLGMNWKIGLVVTIVEVLFVSPVWIVCCLIIGMILGLVEPF